GVARLTVHYGRGAAGAIRIVDAARTIAGRVGDPVPRLVVLVRGARPARRHRALVVDALLTARRGLPMAVKGLRRHDVAVGVVRSAATVAPILLIVKGRSTRPSGRHDAVRRIGAVRVGAIHEGVAIIVDEVVAYLGRGHARTVVADLTRQAVDDRG